MPGNNPAPPHPHTIASLAALTGLSRHTLHHYVRAGHLPPPDHQNMHHQGRYEWRPGNPDIMRFLSGDRPGRGARAARKIDEMEQRLQHPAKRQRPWYGIEDIGRLLDESNIQIGLWMDEGIIRSTTRAGKRVGHPEDVLFILLNKKKTGQINRDPAAAPLPGTAQPRPDPSRRRPPPTPKRSPQTNQAVPAAMFLPPD